jgi:hypothetical protein
MSDEPVDEPVGPDSIITRAVRSGLFDRLIMLTIGLIGGAGGGAMSHRSADAGETAVVTQAAADVIELRTDFDRFRSGYYERQRENRTKIEADLKEIEKEQQEAALKLERRLTIIEQRLGVREVEAGPGR